MVMKAMNVAGEIYIEHAEAVEEFTADVIMNERFQFEGTHKLILRAENVTIHYHVRYVDRDRGTWTVEIASIDLPEVSG